VDAEDRLLYRLLEAARTVHQALGPGFIESIYGRALTLELRGQGFVVNREKSIKVWYGNHVVGRHRLDLVVDRAVILELKAARSIIPVNVAQMVSYLHATGYQLGVLLNFGTTQLQWECVRSARAQNKNPDEPCGSSGFN
jgi:GxxExxY protein